MNLENIGKEFIKNGDNIEILKDITYNFEKGKFYAIMGHSGSGKTTLVKILGLCLRASKGKYFLNEKDVSLLSEDDLTDLRMNQIGFVFQDFNLDPYLKAYENVFLPMIVNKMIDKQERKVRAFALLEKVGLSDRVEHFPKELSGGEQQRVAIARALANNPHYILADEPTGNLDEKNEIVIFQELKRLSREGKCVIVVTHSNDVTKYADVIIHLENGIIK